MTRASGVGSMPGTDFAETLRLVFGELPDLPHLPELPDRGVHAAMTGRALALVADLDADLQPAGWRLTGSTGAPGADQRRARSLLAQDLDLLEELGEDYAGTFKVQVVGPWTLAATVEKPRGDRLLADRGARRELAEALAQGVADHVADLRRRLPGATLVVQVDEPALPAVMGGGVPTASGFHRHRSVNSHAAAPALEWLLAAIIAAGAEPVVHCCAADVPVDLLIDAGARGVSVDLDVVAPATYDALATLLEAGAPVHLGVVPTTEPVGGGPTRGALEASVLRFLEMLGLDPEAVGASLVLTPACGLAGASTAWSRTALGLVRRVAAELG